MKKTHKPVYLHNEKTNQLTQLADKTYEPRNVFFKSVQSAKKYLAAKLWISDDVELKIKKTDDKYTIESSRFCYSPLLDREYFIKKLKVEFKNIKPNYYGKYDNIKQIDKREYKALLNDKLNNRTSEI